MKKWRCANDCFGCCATKPQWKQQPAAYEQAPFGGTCKKDKATYGHFQLMSQMGLKAPPTKAKKERRSK